MDANEAVVPIPGLNLHSARAAKARPDQVLAPPRPQPRNEATRAALLTGPILPTLLRLALPTMVVLVAQTAVNIAEGYYVGFLGTDALAGVALVFPVFMLMTMMSNGGIGSGVSSAVARAIGAGRKEDADALVFHAIVLGVIFGALFTFGTIWGGPVLYRALGGRADALDAAVKYSNYLFAGAIAVWIVNLQAAALRGSGNVRVPAMVTLVGALVMIPTSPILIFGFGPVPRLGIGGAGIAFGVYYGAAMLFLLRYMASGHAGLTFRVVPLRVRLFADILKVGVPTAVNTVLTNLTVILVTGAVGTVRHHGARGLRYCLPARLCDDPDPVRAVHRDLDHGRHQYRRRRGRARQEDRRGQRLRRSGADGRNWHHCRRASAALAQPVQPRCRGAARRHDLFAHRGAGLCRARLRLRHCVCCPRRRPRVLAVRCLAHAHRAGGRLQLARGRPFRRRHGGAGGHGRGFTRRLCRDLQRRACGHARSGGWTADSKKFQPPS